MVSDRDARPVDAPAIAAVHVASWKVAYRGMLPNDYFDYLSINDGCPGGKNGSDRIPTPMRSLSWWS